MYAMPTAHHLANCRIQPLVAKQGANLCADLHACNPRSLCQWPSPQGPGSLPAWLTPSTHHTCSWLSPPPAPGLLRNPKQHCSDMAAAAGDSSAAPVQAPSSDTAAAVGTVGAAAAVAAVMAGSSSVGGPSALEGKAADLEAGLNDAEAPAAKRKQSCSSSCSSVLWLFAAAPTPGSLHAVRQLRSVSNKRMHGHVTLLRGKPCSMCLTGWLCICDVCAGARLHVADGNVRQAGPPQTEELRSSIASWTEALKQLQVHCGQCGGGRGCMQPSGHQNSSWGREPESLLGCVQCLK